MAAGQSIWGAQSKRTGLSRRDALRGAGGLGLALLATACGGGGGSGGGSTSSNVGSVSAGSGATLTTSPASSESAASVSGRTLFGVCCYDLFHRAMYSTARFDPYARLKPLADRGITLARFSAGPYWPNDWSDWDARPQYWLSQLDKVFDAGDRLGMKLVPTLLWNMSGLSDHFGEPYGAWGDPNSASRRALERHIPLIVDRYRGRASLFLWEFSNEFNAFADLPNGYQFYPAIQTDHGTPAARTPADNISAAAVMSAYSAMATRVRAHDPVHPMSAGANLPRQNQIHNGNGTWGLDTPEQLQQAMAQTLAGGSDVLSVHIYDRKLPQILRPEGSTMAELLSLARAAADRNGAKLWLGEWGVPASGDDAVDKARFRQLIADIKAGGVDYATMWNYDWDYQPEWSVRADNARAWMLEELGAANR